MAHEKADVGAAFRAAQEKAMLTLTPGRVSWQWDFIAEAYIPIWTSPTSARPLTPNDERS
jgi:hypothetical protein